MAYHDDGGGHGVLVKPVILLRHRRDPPTTHTTPQHSHTGQIRAQGTGPRSETAHTTARRHIPWYQRWCNWHRLNPICPPIGKPCVCMYVPVEGGPHDGMVLNRHPTELLQVGLDAAAACNNEPQPYGDTGSYEYLAPPERRHHSEAPIEHPCLTPEIQREEAHHPPANMESPSIIWAYNKEHKRVTGL